MNDYADELHLKAAVVDVGAVGQLLLTLEAAGSFAHHVRNSLNPTYRIMDFLAILMLYEYFVACSVWGLFTKRVGFTWLQYVALGGIATTVAMYEDAAPHLSTIAIGCGVASGVLLLLAVLLVHRTWSCTSIAVHTGITIAMYGAAFFMDQSTDQWTADAEHYDLYHGMWHLWTAQAQFVMIGVMIAPQTPLDVDWTAFAANVVLLVTLTLCAYRDALDARGVCVASAAAVAVGAALDVARRRECGACVLNMVRAV